MGGIPHPVSILNECGIMGYGSGRDTGVSSQGSPYSDMVLGDGAGNGAREKRVSHDFLQEDSGSSFVYL